MYCKYASILGPTIFKQNVTQSEAFKTERTQQLAHLPTFCKIINLTQQAENFRAKANSSSNGALTKSQSTKSYLCYHGLDQASIDEFVFPGTHLLSITFDYSYTRSVWTLWAPTSRWRPFRPLDFVLRALWALRPCDPHKVDHTSLSTTTAMMH